MTRIPLATSALLGAALLLPVGGCGSAEAEPGSPGAGASSEVPARRVVSSTATRVEVAVIEPSEARLQLRLPGEVEGSRDALLAASLGGFVERVLVQEGDLVREGQVLARVDSALHGARTSQARVELAAAERELARAERLADALPAQQRDAADTRVNAARAALRVATVTASRGVIRAPFAGTVAAVDAERGEVMTPGAPMIRLVQLDPARISLSVPDRDVVALTPGAEVRVQVGAAVGERRGRVAFIHPAADLQTRAFEVEVEVANADGRLLPGMIAQVEVSQPVGGARPVIPQHVLVTRLEGNGVFVAEDDESTEDDALGTARWRPVTVEAIVRSQVVIASGLEAGERVVVVGHRELAEGDALLVTREGRCCTGGRVSYGATVADGAAAAEGAAEGGDPG